MKGVITRFYRSVTVYVTATALLTAALMWGLGSAAAQPSDPYVVSVGPNLSADLGPLDPDQRIQIYLGKRDPSQTATVRRYYASGAARRDQQTVIQRAQVALDAWAAQSCSAGLASCRGTVVIDIDDTILDSSAFYAAADPPFTFHAQRWRAFRDACQQRVIPPTRTLIRRLHAMGWHVVLLTGRADTVRGETVSCLHRRGVVGWDDLMMRGPQDAAISASRWKATQRQRIRDAGWRIVASIGDQLSDMPSESGTTGFLMPNPMYAVS